jgi:putative hydrolase of the HAD superfamily
MLTQMALQAVLFDYADTLVHSERFDYDVCMKKMVQTLSKNEVSVAFESFKQGYFDSRDRFYMETEKTLEEQDFAERITETLRSCGISLNARDQPVQEAAEAFSNCFAKSLTIESYLPSLLERLHKRWRLAVVSNMSFAEAIFQSLKEFDIYKNFDAVIVSGIIGWRKPSPRIFESALQALKVKAEESVFVGDSPKADVEGAKQLGMKTVLLVQKNRKQPSTDTYQFYIKKGKSNVKPDKTIIKLADLPKALQNLSKQP